MAVFFVSFIVDILAMKIIIIFISLFFVSTGFTDDLDSYLKENNTSSFLVSEKGKIIVEKEFKSDGLLCIVEDAKEKLFKEVETNLILSNEANSLKKFNLILNKYKTFKDLLRKVLDEC